MGGELEDLQAFAVGGHGATPTTVGSVQQGMFCCSMASLQGVVIQATTTMPELLGKCSGSQRAGQVSGMLLRSDLCNWCMPDTDRVLAG